MQSLPQPKELEVRLYGLNSRKHPYFGKPVSMCLSPTDSNKAEDLTLILSRCLSSVLNIGIDLGTSLSDFLNWVCGNGKSNFSLFLQTELHFDINP